MQTLLSEHVHSLLYFSFTGEQFSDDDKALKLIRKRDIIQLQYSDL